MLYDVTSARLLLGCLLIKPSLCLSDKYQLDKDDWQNDFHLRIWQAVNSLARKGANSISDMDIYTLCENNKPIKDLFQQNDLSGFIDTIKQLSKVENFDLYYDNIKRMSLLRAYNNSGFDVSKFEKEPEKYTIQQIVEWYDGLAISIKKQFYKDNNTTEIKAGDGSEAVKEMFKQSPAYGASTFSLALNTAVRGWQAGQLTLYGAVSGSGKTALGLYNLALVCCPELWDDEKQCYMQNPCYQHKAGLILQYELNAQEELTPKLIGSISGVPTYHFLNGKYEPGEEERVDRAIKILHESNIYIVTMPQFTIDKLKATIKEYATLHNVGYVVFDYISFQSSASSDIAKRNAVATRADMVLSDIASSLKDIAIENNVAVLTFSQTNDKVNQQEILDAGCLAGSRAMQDKLDVGGIIMPLRKNECDICDMVLESGKCNIRPSRVIHLFKVRFGNQIQHLKIWGNLDLNTGRWTDCWCTDSDNKLYDMGRTKLVYNND